jgi:hypothetical protein
MPSDFSTAFAAEFAAAADDAGMRVSVQVRPADCAVRPYEFRAAFDRPDVFTNANAQSSDWEIEYVATDAPELVEGDEVEIDEVVYRVRQAPTVPPAGVGGVDGTFRRALLTRVAGSCE